MAIPTLAQFIEHLTASGVIASDALQEFIPPRVVPQDAAELARELVRQNKLTKFQADVLWKGQGKSLILDNYVLLEKIGQGGMGAVYKAEHRRMKRVVALKVLPSNVMHDKAAIARFEREVRAAARINHPHIVTAYDAGRADKVHFLVMEYVAGSDLSAVVKKHGPLPVEHTVAYVLQAARGLEAAHAEGVVHRDIKPANLLLDSTGTVKILDMGLARILGDTAGQAELTGTGAIMGTVDYMAPEQALSTKRADARADIYSLGCTLHYLLTGKSVYDGDSMMAKLLAHREQSIPVLRSLRPEVPEQLDSVFRKMVAKNVEDRYRTMREVITDLERCGLTQEQTLVSNQQHRSLTSDNGLNSFLNDLSLPPVTIALSGQSPPAKPQASRKTTMLAGGGILAAILLLAVVLTLNSKNGTPVTKSGGTKSDSKKRPPATDQPVAAVPAGLPSKPDPAFARWVKSVTDMPADQQLNAVVAKLKELNPGFDGNLYFQKIENGVVTELGFPADNVTNLAPVRALVGLRFLECRGNGVGTGKLSDLSPLQGLRLTALKVFATRVSDLSPLRGLPLTYLNCSLTPVENLGPLKGLPLTGLECSDTKVTDVSPLKDTPLKELVFDFKPKRDAASLRAISTLERINHKSTGDFWNDLPGEQAAEAVAARLKERNPGFDGRLSYRIEKGVVVEVGLTTDNVTDLSPVRSLTALRHLDCRGSSHHSGKVTDLKSLQGMPLGSLRLFAQQISSLSSLKGMPLTFLDINITKVADLSPLRGMPLKELSCNETLVTDLSPLKDTPLQRLSCNLDLDRDVDVLRSIKTLQNINGKPAASFWGDLSTEVEVRSVARKLQELNPGFDGKTTQRIENGVVMELSFHNASITDISPIRKLTGLKGLKLFASSVRGGKLTDLSPLRGTKLTSLDVAHCQVSDLSPLSGLPLTGLNIGCTQVADLSPLRGAPLTWLDCTESNVTDLEPLQGTPIKELHCSFKPSRDTTVLRSIKTLERINHKLVAEFWHALPGEIAIEELVQKLRGLNPAFDGKVGYKILEGVVVHLELNADTVHNISPVAALRGLKTLNCSGSGQGRLTDLSPLQGMSLTHLQVTGTGVHDLWPLNGMSLALLHLHHTQVADLSPLKGMPLKDLNIDNTPVTNLKSLAGLKLESLTCRECNISDVSPLKGMPLTNLHISRTGVSDLTPLKDSQLVYLGLDRTLVSNLAPLLKMPLKELWYDLNLDRDAKVLRQIKTLERINGNPAASFWQAAKANR